MFDFIDQTARKAIRWVRGNGRGDRDAGGLGEPVFDKLHAELGKAMLSINAVKDSNTAVALPASKSTAPSTTTDSTPTRRDGYAPGPTFRAASRAASPMAKTFFSAWPLSPWQLSCRARRASTKGGEVITVEGKGRHDPCVVPRAVPIVEAMTALVLADFYLRNKVVKV
jgi:chorismate synthase